MEIEHLIPPDVQYAAYDAEDEASLERISHYDAHVDAVDGIGTFNADDPSLGGSARCA